MAVFRVPQDFGSIVQAVAAVQSGDTILVCPGVYHQTVIIPNDKPGIRIIADSDRVILDGLSRMAAAFLIQGNNTEIKGFTIQNYLVAGIRASAPSGVIFLSGTKLIHNRIINISPGAGIEVLGTFATLIWQNQVSGCGANGINLQARDTWVVANQIDTNHGNGIAALTQTTVGNMMIDNRVTDNGMNGIADSAGFNLIYDNLISGNGIHGVHELSGQGPAGLVGNVISNNHESGIQLDTMGHMVTGNTISGNLSGIRIEGDFNTIESNRIFGNRVSGITIGATASNNLVIRNQFNQNLPIERINPRNDLIENCGLPC